MSARVSVLIPAYNAAPYLVQAVNSILVQSYSDLELIVVDDCSSDGTYEALVEMARRDDRIHVVRNDVNSGIVHTLNRGLSLCTGYYVARMDADDIAEPNRIRQQVAFLDANPDFGLVGVNNVSFSNDGRVFAKSNFPLTWSLVRKTVGLSSPVSHNWLCRKSLYDDLGGYRDMAPVEDFDFVYRCVDRGIKLTNLPFVGMQIRVHGGGISGQSGLRQQLAFRYAKRLHGKRIRGHDDGFSRDDYLIAVSASEKSLARYSRAHKSLMSGLSATGFWKKVSSLSFAFFNSSYMASYLLRRIGYHLLTKKQSRPL